MKANDRALDWAELALMHRLTPFTLDDFALLVDTATERRFTKDDRHDLGLLADPVVGPDHLRIYWTFQDNPDQPMGGADQ